MRAQQGRGEHAERHLTLPASEDKGVMVQVTSEHHREPPPQRSQTGWRSWDLGVGQKQTLPSVAGQRQSPCPEPAPLSVK